MSNPHLSVVERLPLPVNDDVVAALENLLDLAKSGEIVAIALASANRDHGCSTSYVAGNSAILLLGAIAVLDATIKAAVVAKS